MCLIATLLTILVFCGGCLALAETRSGGLALALWHANAAQFAPPPAAVLGYWGQTLAWATWPAWPLALWTLWEGRRRTVAPGTRVLITAAAVSFVVLVFLDDPREVYALPLVLPLALLAGAGVPSLRRGAANALAWFGVMSAGFLGAVMWLGWFAMMTGVPPRIAERFSKLEPGYLPQFSWTVFALALAVPLAWPWLVLRKQSRGFHIAKFRAGGHR